MEKKEIIRDLLLILCVFILFVIPWTSVFGIQDPDLLEAALIFQRSAGVVILTAMALHLVYQTLGKTLTKEMEEEKIREAEQKDEKQLLFKPTIGLSVIFMFFLFLSVLAIFFQFRDHNVNFEGICLIIGFMVLWIWLWYTVTVFIFTEDSVHIKPHLIYLFGIDRKTVIRYADITSVSPDARIKGDFYGVDRRYRIVISTNGVTQSFSLVGFNSEIIAKIYLRFKEKLGDKVKLE
jgi:hypothetical protein